MVELPTLLEAACSARIKLHPRSAARSSSNQQRLILSVDLAPISKTRTRQPRTIHSAAVSEGNNKNQVESSAPTIQRRITQAVVCLVTPQITANSSQRLAGFLELTIKQQPIQYSVHPNPPHQALHFLAALPLQITILVICSEVLEATTISRARTTLPLDSLGLPINSNNRSLEGFSVILEHRLVVACLVVATTLLSNKGEAHCLGTRGPIINRSNPQVSLATPTHRPDFLEAPSRNKMRCKLLKL